MHRLIPLLLITALAAAARSATGVALPPELAAELRRARTVSIEVRQVYDWRGEEQGTDDAETKEPESEGPVGVKTPAELLPIAADATFVLRLAGWEVVEAGGKADLRLLVESSGSALGTDYVGTVFGHNYSGAELSGRVTLRRGETEVMAENFAGEIPPPMTINRFYSQREDAPFGRLRADYIEALYKLVAEVSGFAPVLAGLKGEDYEQRAAAARVLFARGDAASTPALLGMLANGDENLRTIAAAGLGVFGDATAFPALIQALRADAAGRAGFDGQATADEAGFDYDTDDLAARRSRAREISMLPLHEALQWALLQNPAPDKVARLAAVSGDRQFPAPGRCGIALVLGRLGGEAAGDALLAMLREETPSIRTAAVTALNNAGYWEQRRVADAIMKLTTDARASVRKRARVVLAGFAAGSLAHFQDEKFGRDGAGYRHIEECLSAPDPLVRLGAVRQAAYVGERLNPVLGRLIQTDPVPAVREAALEMLADQRDPALDPMLTPALADADEDLRLRALTALDSDLVGDAEGGQKPASLPGSAAGPLLAMLDSDTPPEPAWRVLARAQGPEAIQALLGTAKREGARPALREIAVIELVRRRDRQATPLVAALLGRPGAMKHEAELVEAAAKLDDPALLDPLFTVLRKGPPGSRPVAVRILGGMSHTRSVGPLIAALAPAEYGGGELAGLIHEALQNLTGVEHAGNAAWLRWWKQNEGKPIVRPAPKKPAEETPAEKPDEEIEEPKSG